MMDATKNRPLYGCTNCYEDYSWPAVDLAVYEGECWCENCWDERRWEGDLPYFSDLDDFVPEHEKQLRAERERVRVLREGMRLIQYRTLLSPIVEGIGGTVDMCGRISSETLLATTEPEDK